MRSRASLHQEAVSQRLALLSAELSSVRDEPHVPLVRPVAGPPPPTPEVRIPTPGRHAARRPSAYAGWRAVAGRVSLGPAQTAVIAVLVAVGLAVTTWWVLRDRAEPLAGPPMPGPALVSPLPMGSGPPTTGLPASDVVVDVAGKVRDPGIVVLEPGSRVVDALEAAGGARKGVDLAGINLARLLVDGEQILVGATPAPGRAASSLSGAGPAPAGALVNLNTASLTELDGLPGVGPVTGQAILDWRAENGGFSSVDQLLDVSGVGEATLADLAPLVTVG